MFQPASPHGPLDEHRYTLFNEVILGISVYTLSCIAIALTRLPGGIALFWPSAAVAGAVLIRMPRVRWPLAAAVVWLGVFCASVLVAHRTAYEASLFAAINIVEAGLMVGAFRFLRPYPYPKISVEQAAVMTAVFGVVIPGISALLGASALMGHYDLAFVNGLAQWWSSHTIGACLLGPPVILFSGDQLLRLVRRSYLLTNFLTLAVCLAVGYLTYRYIRYPFVTIGLTLLIAAFRVGGFGASLLALATGLEITGLWAWGLRPLGLEASFQPGTLIGLPVVALLATVMPCVAVGLGSDARRNVAGALRASERRFRVSMEHSPIGMLIADLKGVWTYGNIALQNMLGYTVDELRNLGPGGPSDPQDWESSAARWKPLLSGQVDSYDTVRRFRHKDGHWIWTHVAVSTMRDENGRPMSLIAQIESMEARRRAEEKLAEERERLRITLQSITDAVVTADSHTKITYINPAAEELLGVTMIEAEGRRVQELIHLTDADTGKQAANILSQSALHARTIRREHACVLHRADGGMRMVADTVSPVTSSNGFVSGLVIVLRDATVEADRERDLRHRALHDPLTGLSNRADFDNRMREIFRRTRHTDRPAALLAIDLDKFKAVNDTAGHAAGDAMLRKVADVCTNTVRSSDVVARLGGDEFGIILDKCAPDQARTIAEKLLQALNPLRMEWDGTIQVIGASIGVAQRLAEMTGEQDWMAAADKACYDAKHAGRGQVRLAPAAPPAAVSEPAGKRNAERC